MQHEVWAMSRYPRYVMIVVEGWWPSNGWYITHQMERHTLCSRPLWKPHYTLLCSTINNTRLWMWCTTYHVVFFSSLGYLSAHHWLAYLKTCWLDFSLTIGESTRNLIDKFCNSLCCLVNEINVKVLQHRWAHRQFNIIISLLANISKVANLTSAIH